MEPYADFLKGNNFWLESSKQPLSGEDGFRFQIYKCSITECGLCGVSTRLCQQPTYHPSLSIETHSGDVYAEANVTKCDTNVFKLFPRGSEHSCDDDVGDVCLDLHSALSSI